MTNIFFRDICIPKRKAIVINNMEKEHGCTESRRAETRTSGRSHTPSLLIFQMMEEVEELYLSARIPIIAATNAPAMIRSFFILIMELQLP